MNLVKRMSSDLGVSPLWISKMISKAPYSYKTYKIPRKNGGFRTISQPAKETKYLQYWLIENILSSLPIHGSATAYRKGASIKDNASRHKGNRYLAKFDFSDFFPSIKGHDFVAHLENHATDTLTEIDIENIIKLTFRANKHQRNYFLSIGSPTSPLISNTLLLEFDTLISGYCEILNIAYTRYADDLTFSTNVKDSLFELTAVIQEILAVLAYPNLSLNHEKTVFSSKKFNRTITGLVITNDGNISLGRDRKRFYSCLVHKYKHNQLSKDEALKLAGYLAFSASIEPEFIERLRKKYSSEIITNLISGKTDT